ncbi:MAG: hypothetical protein F6K65_37450, partial [Moorea sp. SIO3C2]|nr:hypothetical protein [Moorena sp. SIO3C2]
PDRLLSRLPQDFYCGKENLWLWVTVNIDSYHDDAVGNRIPLTEVVKIGCVVRRSGRSLQEEEQRGIDISQRHLVGRCVTPNRLPDFAAIKNLDRIPAEYVEPHTGHSIKGAFNLSPARISVVAQGAESLGQQFEGVFVEVG